MTTFGSCGCHKYCYCKCFFMYLQDQLVDLSWKRMNFMPVTELQLQPLVSFSNLALGLAVVWVVFRIKASCCQLFFPKIQCVIIIQIRRKNKWRTVIPHICYSRTLDEATWSVATSSDPLLSRLSAQLSYSTTSHFIPLPRCMTQILPGYMLIFLFNPNLCSHYNTCEQLTVFSTNPLS